MSQLPFAPSLHASGHKRTRSRSAPIAADMSYMSNYNHLRNQFPTQPSPLGPNAWSEAAQNPGASLQPSLTIDPHYDYTRNVMTSNVLSNAMPLTYDEAYTPGSRSNSTFQDIQSGINTPLGTPFYTPTVMGNPLDTPVYQMHSALTSPAAGVVNGNPFEHSLPFDMSQTYALQRATGMAMSGIDTIQLTSDELLQIQRQQQPNVMPNIPMSSELVDMQYNAGAAQQASQVMSVQQLTSADAGVQMFQDTSGQFNFDQERAQQYNAQFGDPIPCTTQF